MSSISAGHAFYCEWLLPRQDHALGGPPIAKPKRKLKASRAWGQKRHNPYGEYIVIHKGTREWS